MHLGAHEWIKFHHRHRRICLLAACVCTSTCPQVETLWAASDALCAGNLNVVRQAYLPALRLLMPGTKECVHTLILVRACAIFVHALMDAHKCASMHASTRWSATQHDAMPCSPIQCDGIYECMPACIHVCTCVCACVRMDVCMQMYGCMSACICMCRHIGGWTDCRRE